MRNFLRAVTVISCYIFFVSFNHKPIRLARVVICTPDSTLPNQDSYSTTDKISEKVLKGIDNRYTSLNRLVTRRTEQMLKRMEKKELNLQKKKYANDSSKAQILSETKTRYQKLVDQVNSKNDLTKEFPLKEYISGVDSLQTALNFLKKNSQSLLGIPEDKMLQVKEVSEEVLQFQNNLQKATDIQQFLKEREQFLQSQFSNGQWGKELAGIHKEVFYVQQQLIEYKTMLQDRKKLEAKLLSCLVELPTFKNFMEKNSYLSQLFGLPSNYGSIATLNGLQTRDAMQQFMGQFLGVSGNNGGNLNNNGVEPSQYARQQIAFAQQQISDLKNKLKKIGYAGGSGDITLPKSKQNEERTKTFLRRMEFGMNMQTHQPTTTLPALANMAWNVGYKFDQSTSAGIGLSYRLGLGRGINHISFSHQGIGFRSYFNSFQKRNFGISGGFEYNYMQQFVKLPSIQQYDIWQKSALVGIIKRTKVRSGRNATIQLLFDALYKEHLPSSAPLIFRMGYNFK